MRLYTRKNINSYQILNDSESILQSNFNPDLPTIIFSDGWSTSPESEACHMIKNIYLMTMDCNLFIIDWEVGSKRFYIPQSIQHSYAAAKQVTQFLFTLQNVTGIDFSSIHMIGMSLGAHLVGFVGKGIGNDTIGRITGLDPAGPCFIGFRNEHRLHYTDAKFVDVILGNIGGFGIDAAIGDVNFRPNDQRIQPGCTDKLLRNGDILSLILDKCSHARAFLLYFNSMLYPSCLPVGHSCSDYKSFVEGKCHQCGPDGSKCAIMGYQASKSNWSRRNSPAIFYLNTTSNFNFCLFHYHIEIELRNISNLSSHKNHGRMLLNIIGSRLEHLFVLSQRSEIFEHGRNYQYLVTTSEDIGEIVAGKFLWFRTVHKSNNQLFINCIKIVHMNTIERQKRYPVLLKNMEENIYSGNWTPLKIVSDC
ncbi:pancreatic triacylglycerol lipase-like [Centruroides sculpturatus]|uniref:pancreatic triacylglycerol lipase-like n=1 Tax=Centruroides sculpturatus TaxID=218467 RepID=UPI000C6E7C66|nr:pancreatic triacylglycerol lipase-like [Centruroides sculpturatus]